MDGTGLRTVSMLRSTLVAELAIPLLDESDALMARADTASGEDSVRLVRLAKEKEALALRVVDTSLVVFPETNAPITEPYEAYSYARLYYKYGRNDRGLEFAQHLLLLIEEDLEYLATVSSEISRKKREVGDDVLRGYLSQGDPRKWPADIRRLNEDFSMAHEAMSSALKAGDTAGYSMLSNTYTSIQSQVGLRDPYGLPDRGR
jgi:hypothetical protein